MVNYKAGAILKVPGQPDTFHILGDAIKRFKALPTDKQDGACIMVGVEAGTEKTLPRRKLIEALSRPRSGPQTTADRKIRRRRCQTGFDHAVLPVFICHEHLYRRLYGRCVCVSATQLIAGITTLFLIR
jgi:hypothetical protein